MDERRFCCGCGLCSSDGIPPLSQSFSRLGIARTSSALRSAYRKRSFSCSISRLGNSSKLDCTRLNEMVLSIYPTAATPSDRRPSSPPVGDTRLRAFSQQRNPAARTAERVSMRRTIRLSCDNRIVPIRPQGRTISHRKPRRRGLRSGSRRTRARCAARRRSSIPPSRR